jgi:ribonuclease Z
VFGIYGLLSTFSLMGRKTPIHIYAPEEYGTMLISHLNDFDIHLAFEIVFTGLEAKNPVRILDEKHVTVSAFPLQHRVPSFGFLFRQKPPDRKIIKEKIIEYNIPGPRIPAIKKGQDFITSDGTVIKNEELTIPPPEQPSYAYCSDTKYFPALSSYVKDVTLLYHEATFDKNLADLAKLTGHSTTVEAAQVALDSSAKTLIIGHYSARYRNISPLVEEARTIFPATYPAIDGRTYEVGKPELY